MKEIIGRDCCRPFSHCVADGDGQQCGVAVIEAGDGVAEADGGAGGEAG